MEKPATTIAMIPHEKFSLIRQSLESVLANTPEPRRLIFIDGGSPRSVAQYLEVQARIHDFTLVRSDYFLQSNEARNLAMAYVHTEFVAMVDNDVIVDPGWLTPLEQCAHETGAAVVSPLCCIGPFVHARIHLTIGECQVVETGGRREMHERFVDSQALFEDVMPRVERAQSELVDSHALLMRSDALTGDAWFDEEIRLEEHVDISLSVRGAGGTLWLEPRSIVTYIQPKHLHPLDLPFYVEIWSEAEGRVGLARVAEKWRLSPDDPWLAEKAAWAKVLRLRGYRPYRSPFSRILRRSGREPRQIVDRAAQQVAVRYYNRRRNHAAGPRLVHAASWLGTAEIAAERASM